MSHSKMAEQKVSEAEPQTGRAGWVSRHSGGLRLPRRSEAPSCLNQPLPGSLEGYEPGWAARHPIFAMSLRDKACAGFIGVAQPDLTGQTVQGRLAVPEGQSDTSPAFQRREANSGLPKSQRDG